MKPALLNRQIRHTATAKASHGGRLLAWLTLPLICVQHLSAANYSWSGGGGANAYWNNNANWGYAGVPANGDTVIFPASQPNLLNTNNIAGLILNQIRFVGAGGGYDIRGNAFTLTNGIMATNTAGANAIKNGITLATADVTVNVAGSVSLTLNGPVSGGVGVTKTGAGTLAYVSSGNSYTGTTAVNAGLLTITATAWDGGFGGPLVIGDGSGAAATVQLLLNNEIPNSAPITINDNGTLDLNNYDEDIGTNLTMHDSAALKTGTGTLTLSPNSTITLNGCYPTVSGKLNLNSGTCTVQANSCYGWMNASLSGSGGITKEGVGGIVLNASNSFTGPLTINNGTVYVFNNWGCGATNGTVTVNNSAILSPTEVNVTNKTLVVNSTNSSALWVYSGNDSWSGNITLGGAVGVSVATSCALTLNGPIGGSGSLTKSSPGTLTLAGPGGNTYAGTTIVNAGSLVLNKPSGYAIPGDAIVSGSLLFSNSYQMPETADVLVNSGGLFDLAGCVQGVDTLRGSGTVNFGSGGWLYLGVDNGSSEFSGSFTGIGYAPGYTIGKWGSGTFTESGTNTFSAGITHVYSGKLVINGFQQSPVTVDSGATLGGSGTIGNLTAYGTIAPGASPGILTSSNATFSSSGNLTVELGGPTPGPGGYDQLNVRGTNKLGNASLTVVPAFVTPVASGQQFVIVNNDGAEALTGTFSGLSEGSTITSGGYKFTLSYAGGTGNDAVLTLTDVPGVGVAGVVTSGNGNAAVDADECNNLTILLTNKTGSTMTGVFATLSSGNPNVLVTQPMSAYADIAAAGKGTNGTPFQISVLPSFVPGSFINLNLAVVSASHGAFVVPVRLPSGEVSPNPVRADNNTSTSIPDVGSVESTNVVGGFTGPIMKVGVSLYLTHTYDQDLTNLSLIGPDGTTVMLSAGNGGGGQNYGAGTADANRTLFDDGAAVSITAGTPPFVGAHRPQSPLNAFIGNTNANGNWRLHIADGYGGSLGTLRAWSLFLYPVTSEVGGGACALCPDGTLYTNTLDASSAVLSPRLFRDTMNSGCGTPKAFPGTYNGSFYYHAYPFYNASSSACITVTLTSFGGDFMSGAWLGDFNPTNPAPGYLGDTGSSTAGAGVLTYSINVPANSTFVVVVNNVSTLGAYSLSVSGGDCAPRLNIAPAGTGKVKVSWPTVGGGYKLESVPELNSTGWNAMTNEPIASGGRYHVTNSSAPPTNRFYRLHRP